MPPSTIRRPGVAFIHFTCVCYPRTSTIPMHPLGPASGAPIDRLGVQKKKKYIYIYTYIYAVAARSTTDAHGHQLFCYICTLVARRTCDYRAFLLFQFSDQGVARAVLYLLFRWSVVRRPTSLYQRKIGEGNFG